MEENPLLLQRQSHFAPQNKEDLSMKIRDLLAVESIDLNGKVTGKNEALDAMVALMAKSGKINDVEKYRKGVYAREEEGTTGIGEGIAIPHCLSLIHI